MSFYHTLEPFWLKSEVFNLTEEAFVFLILKPCLFGAKNYKKTFLKSIKSIKE